MERDETADQDALVRAATSHLAERFTSIEPERIEQTVRRHVEQRCANARITNFVGIFAERSARAELERS